MRHMLFLRTLFAGTALLAGLVAGTAGANPSILFDLKSGHVLAHEDAFQRWYPASLTKLMTLYVTFRAIEAGELTLNSPIKVSKHSASQPPSKMGYKPGQIVTLDNAVKMLVVKSANDIATAVGENVGGSEKAFVARMNQEAARLGMTGSHFANANGLHDVGQYTTAHDLAILTRAIRTEFPQYAPYFTIEALGAGKKVLKTGVDVLGRFNGADGMKTGFICPSGFNLVATATRGDRTLVAVVLGALNPHVRADQAADLLGNGFEKAPADTTTLAALQPYGEGRDIAPDMRPVICEKPATTEKVETQAAKEKPTFRSLYMHDPDHAPRVVAVGLGGATGPVPQGRLNEAGEEYADVPIPTPRPDYVAATQAENGPALRPTLKASQAGG